MNKLFTFSVIFYIRHDKVDKTNQAPVYMRVTVNGKRKAISINRRFDIDRWEDGQPMGNKNDAKLMRRYMSSMREKIYEFQRDMIDRNETVTAEKIKERFTGIEKRAHSLMQVFIFHNKLMYDLTGKDYSIATYKRYEVTRKHIKEFMQSQYNCDDMSLNEIKYEFITGFEFYLKTVRKCNHNSTMKYIKNFKKVINLAIKYDWLEKEPFQHFQCKIKPVERAYLTKEELTELENKIMIIPRMDQVRDVFVFCCYTGLAFIDVSKLSIDHIVTGIDGTKWINLNRTKTKTKSQIPLLPKAQEILDKYNNLLMHKPGTLLPVITNQKMNAYLKELADMCGITKPLTFHIARHTFATTVTLTNGVPIETVSAMLGHKNLRTTQIYSKVVELKISTDMAALREKLAQRNLGKLSPNE